MNKVNKRIITILLAVTLGLSITPATNAATTQATAVFIDGLQMEFEVPPTIINGSTLVPLRTIFEELGADIKWNNDTRTVTVVKGEIMVTYKIGQMTATRNNETIVLSTSGQIIGNRTLVPLVFLVCC
jgi:peptidoglycan endopeptidase LytE